jgi:hypothetical protein
VHFASDVAVTCPHTCGHATATGREPVQIEADNQVATVVVPVAALACDVAGSVPNFEHSPGGHVGRRSVRSRRAHRVVRGCHDAETERKLLLRHRFEVSAPQWPSDSD